MITFSDRKNIKCLLSIFESKEKLSFGYFIKVNKIQSIIDSECLQI
jgi:hypothetical protein